MAGIACPSCGAPIEFRSSFSVYAVCASCGSTVLRTDRDVSLIGKMADLPEEISPLQIGAGFKFGGKPYTLLGRTRIGWADGMWTEWFAGGEKAQTWLAEAQGFFAFSVERPLEPDMQGALPGLNELVEVGGAVFRVADIKQGTCLGSEGELPFAAPRGRVSTYVDLIGRDGGFAGIEESTEGRRLYVGAYAGFDALDFTGLRRMESWPVPKSGPGRDDDPAGPER